MRDHTSTSPLEPYVPQLVIDWLRNEPASRHRRISGTLAFIDITGFTTLTDRLATKGRVGAEEMSDALNSTFAHLLEVAEQYGADLVKWGGDAMLLMFTDDGVEGGHAHRACAAAYGMRTRLREVGRLTTTAGIINLRMSVGVHSGDFDFFLVGDPDLHRELLVTGSDVSETVRLEALADAGQILVSADTARYVGSSAVGPEVSGGHLLRRNPLPEPSPPDMAIPAASGPIGQPDLGQLLPAALRDHLTAGQPTPEHRTIAIAFVEFSGTDSLLQSTGPEATAAALDDVIRNVSHAAQSHGVTFFESDINVDGGKIMLTAGAPRTAGHDTDRLLRTSRRILDHAGYLPLRVGLNTGHVFAGDFGPPTRRTYSVKGAAINLAARIMGKAQPGQLLATPAAYDHAETRFAVTEVGPFQLKGKPKPVPALAVGEIVGSRERRVGQENQLVGRDNEMAVLTKALDAVRQGHGGLVQLLGEPGIGKSRLMGELVDRSDEVHTLAIVCDEYQATTPYAAFRDLLRLIFGVTERTPIPTARDIVTERIRADAPEVTAWLPLLGDVLDVELPETPETADLDDQFRKVRLETAVLDTLVGLMGGPHLVTVDDAQHMDPASSDLLNKVVAASQHRPWLLLISRRDQPVGWIPEEDLQSIELRVLPLTAEESMTLALSASGHHSLPRPALAALAKKADGNPLFLESLVSQAGPAGTLDELPESIEEVVAAQLDQLSSRLRNVLRHASVLGNQFATADLTELLPEATANLEADLEAGLATFLVADGGGAELRFRHGLIREVAYHGLAFGARRSLHDQAGLAMERTSASTKQELLSFHFLHAGRYDKAWTYARIAGEEASKLYANTEATELFRRAVDAARRLPRGQVPVADIARTLESLGDCWFTIGITDAAAQAYREAYREAREDRLLAGRMVAKQAMVEQRLRRFPHAMRRLRRGLHHLDDAVGAEAHVVRSMLQVRYAISRISQGRVPEAIGWGTAAVDEAERSGDLKALAPAYATLHGIYLAAGQESYRTLGSLALQSYVDLDDLSGQAQCTNNLAVEALENSRWVEAATMFGRAAELYRRIGDTDNEGVATCNHAEVLVNQSRIADADPLLTEALRTAYSVSDDELVALVVRQQGRALVRRGDPAAGLGLLERAASLFTDIDDPGEAFLTQLAISEATILIGDATAALARLDAMLAEGDAEDIADQIHSLRGVALLHLDRRAEAESAFRTALAADDAEQSFSTAVSCLGLARCDLADAADWAQRGDAALRSLGVVAVPVLQVELI